MLFRKLVATTRMGAHALPLVGALPLAALTLAVGAQAQTFEIVSANSGLVLDVPGWSTQPGTQIQQFTKNGGANQQWAIRRAAYSGYEMASVNSGLVLDVPGWSTQPGTQIQQWPENGGANQQWTIRAKGGDTYEIASVNSGLVLDVPGWSTQPGTQIQQWTENGGANQLWTFHSLGTASISVVGQRNAWGGYITITGQGFIPGASLHVTYLGVPPRQDSIVAGIGPVGVAPNGTFSVTDTVYFSSGNLNDAFKYVTVVVEDGQDHVLAIGYLAAVYWVSA